MKTVQITVHFYAIISFSSKRSYDLLPIQYMSILVSQIVLQNLLVILAFVVY